MRFLKSCVGAKKFVALLDFRLKQVAVGVISALLRGVFWFFSKIIKALTCIMYHPEINKCRKKKNL